MAGVDVYKNPSAEQNEGAISGLVNLRTAMPFDYKGLKGAVSLQTSYSTLREGKASPSTSLLLSDRWTTPLGEIGVLVDFAKSQSDTRTDNFQIDPYYPRDDLVAGKRVWVPQGAGYRTMEFERERQGKYAALQWRPIRNLTTSLTYFKSDYYMTWSERALTIANESPYDVMVANGTYDTNGALLTGTLSNPKHNGITLNPLRRVADRDSSTTDLAWNAEWHVAPQWTIRTDYQRVRAKTKGFDSEVATGFQMAKQGLDLTGKMPKLIFDDADRADMANPNKYYWDHTMEHLDQNTAASKVWKADVQYDFDHSVLRDIRFGARVSDRDSNNRNSNPSYHWSGITPTWMLYWNISGLSYLGDPRFNAETTTHPFNNFFNGSVSVPAAVFPDDSLARGYPDSYAKLHSYHDILCAEQSAAQGWGSCDKWQPAKFFGDDSKEVNKVKETTKSFYTQVRFGFDKLNYPIDGNLGVRYVKTNSRSNGYSIFTAPAVELPPGGVLLGQPIPNIPSFSIKGDFENSYSNVLPSLNLRMKVGDKLQFRMALAKAMSPADFYQLQAYTTLSQDLTLERDEASKTVTVKNVTFGGSASGNPMLKPTTSTQLDLTAEWYFAHAGSLTLAVFNKSLKDLVIQQEDYISRADVTGTVHNFLVSSPVNGAKGKARGFELAYQQYYDKLPGWMSGLGLQASFTFVDSSRQLYNPVYSEYCSGNSDGVDNLNLNLNGCDIDGRPFGNLPLQGLSRQSANLSLMYDKGPVSSRLAYNWRSRNLQAVNTWGARGKNGLDANPASPNFGKDGVAWGLPLWGEAYGQLDASFFYKFTENLSVGLEAQNLTSAVAKQTAEQHIGDMKHTWFATGPRYTAQLRYTF